MWSEFEVYLRLGFEHITDPRGYDHILFVVALCAAYDWKRWKELVWMVTAFTLGHSVTLALATMDMITINSNLVEFLIPVTILATSIINVADRRENDGASYRTAKYVLALCFGLIHGMGFSSFLRTILGAEESIVWPLFSFNLGLEVGQIAIVLITLALTFVTMRFLNRPRREWTLLLSGATAGISLLLIFERL